MRRALLSTCKDLEHLSGAKQRKARGDFGRSSAPKVSYERRPIAAADSAHVPGGKQDSAGTTSISRFCCRLSDRRKHSPQFGGVNRVVATA